MSKQKPQKYDDNYQSEFLIRVKVSHIGRSPRSAVMMLKESLDFAAIDSLEFISAATNFQNHRSPLPEMVPFNVNNPFTLDSWPENHENQPPKVDDLPQVS